MSSVMLWAILKVAVYGTRIPTKLKKHVDRKVCSGKERMLGTHSGGGVTTGKYSQDFDCDVDLYVISLKKHFSLCVLLFKFDCILLLHDIAVVIVRQVGGRR